jgi:hypothetical protein
MEAIEAIIEKASIHKISELFTRKPPGLKFNDTDAVVMTAKTRDGKVVSRTFYFCLKPDGTFYEETISKDGSRARRQRLAEFIRRYGMAQDVANYNIKEKINEWCGTTIKVVPTEKEGILYIP